MFCKRYSLIKDPLYMLDASHMYDVRRYKFEQHIWFIDRFLAAMYTLFFFKGQQKFDPFWHHFLRSAVATG